VLVKNNGDSLKFDFRSIGKPFNTLKKSDNADLLNNSVLQGISKKITYEYALGLNTTGIEIEL